MNRWINRLELLLTFVLVVGVLGVLARLVQTGFIAAGVDNGYSVDLLALDVPVTLSGVAAPGAETVGAGVTVHLLPTEPSPLVGLLYLLTWLPGVATVLLAVWTLQKALRRARLGDRALFSAGTAELLRKLGWIAIIGTLVSSAAQMLAKGLLSSVMLTKGYPFHLVASLEVGVIAGVAALAVAEIIRRGLVLLEEVEGTV